MASCLDSLDISLSLEFKVKGSEFLELDKASNSESLESNSSFLLLDFFEVSRFENGSDEVEDPDFRE